jgi:hypothetical protein
VEKAANGPSSRPMRMFAPVYGGLAAALSLCECDAIRLICGCSSILVFVGSGVSVLITESVLDGTYKRFALLATAPFLFCVAIVRVYPSYFNFHPFR